MNILQLKHILDYVLIVLFWSCCVGFVYLCLDYVMLKKEMYDNRKIISLGDMAVNMKRFDMRIRQWLEDEGKQARFRKADDHPDWAAFQRVQKDFNEALYVYVRDNKEKKK